MEQYKKIAIDLIKDEAKKLKPQRDSDLEIDDFRECPNSNLCVVVKGYVTVVSIDSEPDNIIDGYVESYAYCIVDDWNFEGTITVEDEDFNVIETIELNENDFNH